ncbi:MAG: hypothetical protein M8364_13240 [Methylobacter sp.]|uniref:hypothetical protein n=1 Tax=Methylobacter sp. TaxID=2051955 RepID=UPI00258C20D4|nr:hypothetical protein [Methylobacter sp.]MCL7421860.1 hypothetical protein [Methylobacter sp.]
MASKLVNKTAEKVLANSPGSVFIMLSMLLIILSGCMAATIKPPVAELDHIRTMVVVPVESPPLEVTPDLIETRMPVYGHFNNMVLPAFLEEKIYSNPGGILIAGLIGGGDVVTAATLPRGQGAGLEAAATLQEHWTPTLELAREAASQLNAGGINATPSKDYYRLPMAAGDRNAYLGHWQAAIRQWYKQNTSPVDYSGVASADAVLEIGIGTYKIFAGQTSLQVLIKLVDPKSGRVIARTDKKMFSAEDSAQTLLSREGKAFKGLIAETGARLIDQGFSEIGLTQARLAQVDLENERPYDD